MCLLLTLELRASTQLSADKEKNRAGNYQQKDASCG
jgi:hypothetical protein